MCLISVAPKGTDKYTELFLNGLRTAANTNTDGIGYSFKRAKSQKVFISKGYKDIDTVIAKLHKHNLKPDDELIVHQRIGNKGAKNVDMMHPFVLAWDKDVILTNNRYVDLPVMAHNGTFHSYSDNSEFSDTYNFIQKFMYKEELITLLKNDLDFFKDIFSPKLSTNRLVFLFPNTDQSLITLGDYKEDSGYLFSNESYKNKNLRNVGGHETNFSKWRGSEDWEDDLAEYNRARYGDGIYSSSEKKPSAASDFVKETIANRSAATTILGNYRQSSILYEDLVVHSGKRVDCASTGVVFRMFMDMWIPEKYNTSNQFSMIRFNPTEYNYNEFTYKCNVGDDDMGTAQGCYYQMVNFDTNVTATNYEGLHCLRKKYVNQHRNVASDYVYVPHYKLAEEFAVTPSMEYRDKYLGYYTLCKEQRNSKNLLKQINKLMTPANYKERKNLTFKGTMYLTPAAISIYQILLTKELYPEDYQKMLQELTMVLIVN